VNRFPPTLIALLLILGTALLSAAAVKALAVPPKMIAVALPTAVSVPRVTTTPPPAVVTGPLDGLPTPRDRATRRPIAVMLDNFVGARPQSGLGEASIVWEAPVEGGITRLMPIFLERDPATLGPVRSARPYFLDWAAAYHPLLVHDGGSPAAQQEVREIAGLVNVDAVREGLTFHRVSGRVAPHNLFTSTPAIRTLARLRNWTLSGSVATLPYLKAGAPLQPTARNVMIHFATPGQRADPDYDVSYQYDPARNAYLRSVGGSPAEDSLTGRQIEAANVVILVTKMRPIPNDQLGRIIIRTAGTGPATVVEDGKEIKGKWSRTSRRAPLHVLDMSGRAIRLEPGQTWIEVVTPRSFRVR
jgi:hypothetical protein